MVQNMIRKINNEDLLNYNKVFEGDQYRHIKVHSIGEKGDGIAKLQNGMVVIIKDKNVRKGQVINIEITTVKDKFVFAKKI